MTFRKGKQDWFHKRIILLAICIISMIFQFTFVPSYASEEVKNVLILQSYHRGHVLSDREGDAILDTLEESDIKIVPYVEYMDWKRYPDEDNLKQLYSRYKYKYSDKKIDLIITTDDAALKFALQNRLDLFSNAPIVFGGVLKQDSNIFKGSNNVTGAFEGMDPEGTIRIAKLMIPELKKIYVLHDNSESGISMGELILNEAAKFDKDLELSDISDYNLDQILFIVTTFKKDSIIVMASYNFDADKNFLPISDVVGNINEKSAVPIFTIDEPTFGSGSIGGSITSGTIHGKTVAELGLRILAGEEPDKIPVADTLPIYWGFDYNELSRFNISLSMLPENSRIINKPFSFFETYKSLVLSNIVVIIFLFAFIIFLLINLKYRKKIEQTLKDQKERIFNLAYFSPVTGLPNRINLRERLEYDILNDYDRSKKFALIYIDIDNFKEVNDTYGHTIGDQVLHYFADCLSELEEIRNNAFSLGGDEFIILIQDADENKVKETVKAMFAKLSEPFCNEESSIPIEVSGGIVYYPEHGDNYTELLKNSDTAMYRSKEQGKGIITYFEQSMRDEAVKKVRLQKNLRLAIDHGDFVLYYQPQIEAKTGDVWGYEALIRWNSSEFGFVQPLSFIKIAEDSKLIIPIGEWVLETACTFIKSVHDNYNTNCIVSVNISATQLLQDNFVDVVMRILEKSGLRPSFLELEITETVFLHSSVHVIETLERLKSVGIRVALDDFGTGYSSLSYLSHLPISTLKIDKTFIDSFFHSNKNMVLTNAIIKMGHELGLELVVEGVETDIQRELFTQLGCDRIQGFQVGKPVPEHEIIQNLSGFEMEEYQMKKIDVQT